MAKAFISPNNTTNKTIDAIDRRRERERRFMLQKAQENASNLATKITQRLLDERILETRSNTAIQEAIEKQLQNLINMEEFDLQFKIAPIRSITQDPNFISLYITQYVIEDLIDHPKVQDIFGDDLTVYQAIDSVLGQIRPE
jgi:hypothetical protein